MILNFDESGNLGSSGRYFTIASVCTRGNKPLTNTVKKSMLKTKRKFKKFESALEIKASESNPAIKDYMLRKIISKDIEIRYIVADLNHVRESLIKDENLLYNYLLGFLITPLTQDKSIEHVRINIDNRTIKVKSINSFADYIRIKLNFEYKSNIVVDVDYIDSHNSYAIQAADFVANAIYSKYEYGNNYFYNIIKDKVVHRELFPRDYFGLPRQLFEEAVNN